MPDTCPRCGAATCDTETLPGCAACMHECGTWFVRRYNEAEDTDYDVCLVCEDATPRLEAAR